MLCVKGNAFKIVTNAYAKCGIVKQTQKKSCNNWNATATCVWSKNKLLAVHWNEFFIFLCEN